MNDKKWAGSILQKLSEIYPDVRCALDFETPYQLLVATMLSAQTTDKRVNEVTSRLYKVAKTPEEVVALGVDALEGIIKGCGLYHSKAANIIATSRILIEEYGSRVPSDIDTLVKLPGVGRKTANVLVSNAYGVPAIAVDTHVFRVSRRLGLANGKTPEAVELQLMDILPRDSWSLAHHQLITHGRRICDSRKPKCSECLLYNLCRWEMKPTADA